MSSGVEAASSRKFRRYNAAEVASAFAARQIQRPLWREWWFALFLALLLLPCFWQRRIVAGDLSSHLYNSWLALQIRAGSVHGLRIVPQWTNVAFDWLLTGLLAKFGPGPAQRIAVSLAVVIFAGGAFALISAAAGRRSWFLTPCLAVLAYGFVFHIGFFNFYLSLGICFWFLAAFWKGTVRRRLVALPLLALAWLAHPLPVIWAAGAAVYLALAERLPEARRVYLLLAGVALLLAIQRLLSFRYHTLWSASQVFGITGADQAFVYGPKYVVVVLGLLLLWLAWLRRVLKTGGGLGSRPALQLFLLTAAGVVLIPSRIDFPQYGHALVYVADRMSLAAGVLLYGVLAEARVRRGEILALAAVAAVFFGFLYADAASANWQEDQVQALVERGVPRGARAVFLAPAEKSRFNPLTHVMDRACVGRCFSYANYEPSTRQFRIRASAGNGVVVTSYKDSYQLATGDYVVRPQDMPLYQVEICQSGEGKYCVRQLRAGEINGRGKN